MDCSLPVQEIQQELPLLPSIQHLWELPPLLLELQEFLKLLDLLQLQDFLQGQLLLQHRPAQLKKLGPVGPSTRRVIKTFIHFEIPFFSSFLLFYYIIRYF